MSNLDFITPKNMVIAFFVILFFIVLSDVYSYNQTNETIRVHQCVPTNSVTQEFDGDDKSVSSTTKVWYKCNDHGRWLNSYDTLNSLLGND